MKKLVSLCFTVLALVCFTACSDWNTDNSNQENNTNQNPDKQSNHGIGNEESDQFFPNLPSVRFHGANFQVIHWSVDGTVGGTWTPWEEISVDTASGDQLEEEIYSRNFYVEETYDVNITNLYFHTDSELPAKIRAAVNTGDSEFQMMVQRSNTLTGMWLETLFYDLNGSELRYIDLSQPWWNASSVENFTFGGKTQFAASELLLLDKGATACVYFNTQIAADNGITDLYSLVKQGRWSWDVLATYAEIVTNEMNGNDRLDKNDVYGALGSIDIIAYLYAGSGMNMGYIKNDRYFVHSFADETSMNIMSELYDTMYYVDYRFGEDYNQKFKSDGGLFLYGMIKTAVALRDMETNYGILPIPKYDENQEQYYSLVWQHYDSVIGVPSSCGNAQMVSVIIEALSAESYRSVYPVFYDTVLMGKSIRDTKSKEMLQMIFQTRKYDIGMIYDPTTFAWKLWTGVTSDTLASHCHSFANALQQASQEFNDMVDSWY